MNIFYLSDSPDLAAQYHVDRHVVKMVLESAQLLCTAHRLLDGQPETSGKKTTYVMQGDLEKILYKVAHPNHPCTIWSRTSINNYEWLYRLFVSLCDEYTHRYGKTHKCDSVLRDVLMIPPKNIPVISATSPAQAMPVEYRHTDPIVAYRKYYINEKASFAKWTGRVTPEWFTAENPYADL